MLGNQKLFLVYRSLQAKLLRIGVFIISLLITPPPVQIFAQIDSGKIQSERSLNSQTPVLTINKEANNTLFSEILITGGYYSLNFDQRIAGSMRNNWSWRGGISYLTSTLLFYEEGNNTNRKTFSSIVGIPLMLNFFTFDQTSPGHFEAGLGVMPWFGEVSRTLDVDTRRYPGITSPPPILSKEFGAFIPFSVGYRFQQEGGGVFFRINAYGVTGSVLIFMNLGLSLGYTFEK